MSIPVSEKIGGNKANTKMLTKKAYLKYLPDFIIKKEKTGWTVPLGYWLTKGQSTRLTEFYNKALKDKSGIGIVMTSQKADKALVPAWIINDWIKIYKIKT